jgi:hypothetical protein
VVLPVLAQATMELPAVTQYFLLLHLLVEEAVEKQILLA